MSTYFSDNEMRCKCGCGQVKMDPDFMDFLDSVRELLGRPMIVTSGYRCPSHNAAVNGGPEHPNGMAADIKTPNNYYRYELVEAARICGCKRIGFGKTFTHLGMDDTLPNGVYWTY